MKNSVSEESFYVDSEYDEDLERDSGNGDDGTDSDSSMGSNHQSRLSSYNTTWPQSYRQSIDMYGRVVSPSIGFLGTPTLSGFGSSFFSSSLTRRYTPEIFPNLVKPLLSTTHDQEQQPREQQRRSTQHGPEVPSNCSYGQAVLNGINALCGVGILSTPNAVRIGGWAGLPMLFIFSILAWFTAILLRRCLDSEPSLQTYPDIGQAAFGTTGRFVISIILYVELYACCVEYIILEGDNLSSLFQNAHLSLFGFYLNFHHLFALMTTLAVLPTVWLKDLRVLSYISAGGVVASILVVLCLFWAGLVDHVGFESKTSILNLTSLPVAVGLYGYCYSGHAVFPNIYISMAKPTQYPSVLTTCFILVTIMYAGVAVMGYAMFGDTAMSQFTLNMPKSYISSSIALWTTVVNPFTKYALTMAPVALSLEELIPSNNRNAKLYSYFIRTGLVISTLFVGLAVPFFGLVMALIGSSLTMLVTFILPSACFLSILKGKVTRFEGAMCILIIIVGAISSVFGTFSAVTKIIESLASK